MPDKKILVTGATGFAGNHLLEMLTAAPGDDKITATYFPGDPEPPPRPGVTWLPCNIKNPDSVRSSIARTRPTLVYHLAAVVTVKDAWTQATELTQTNVVGTQNLFEAVRIEVPEASILLPSSAEVYGKVPKERIPIREEEERHPMNPYGFSKYCQEEVAGLYRRVFGMRVFIIRPFHYTGPGQPSTFVCSSLARQIAECESGLRKEVLVGNLEAERDFTDIRDVVRVYALIAEAGEPGRPYNVCRGEARPVRAILNQLISKAKKEVPVRVDPTRMRTSDVSIFSGDPSRVKAETGWHPKHDWDDMLSEVLEYWRKEISRHLRPEEEP